MWKFSTFSEFAFYVLLLLALPPIVNSNETPTPITGVCAVCQDYRCATDTTAIWKGNDEDNLWKKEISNCSTDNLNSDVPCRMPNGWLVLLTDQHVFFEWGIPSGAGGVFTSVNMPCADLNLPPKSFPGMCAVCLEKDCATGVRRIYPAGGDKAVWLKENSQTAIQDCTMENLKPDAPCKMANGSLVQLADNPLDFEGIDTYDLRRIFKSQNSPCDDLINSKPSPVTKTPTPTPAAPNNSVADKKGIIIGSVIGIFIISIGVLIWKRNSCGQGQDGDHRHGNNGVPPHDAEDRDEITVQMQPPNVSSGRSPRGNVNGEDDSVGTAGLLG